MKYLHIRIDVKELKNFDDNLEWLRINVGNNNFDWLFLKNGVSVFMADETAATAFKLRWGY